MANISYKELMELAIAELDCAQRLLEEDEDKYFKTEGLIPPSFPDGCGKVFLTTRKGIMAIQRFGEVWRDQSARRQQIKIDDIRILAAQAFGAGLRENMDVDRRCQDLTKRLEEAMEAINDEITHYFPCHLFNEHTIYCSPFQVGPVCFMPRIQWLDEMDKKTDERQGWTDSLRCLSTKMSHGVD